MKKIFLFVSVAMLFCAPLRASTTAYITFSTDANGYLTVTLSQSITFVVNSDASYLGLEFVIKGADPTYSTDVVGASISSSSIVFTINGTDYTTNQLSSDDASEDMSASDLYLLYYDGINQND